MTDFNVLFAVILRFQDTDIDVLDEKLEEYSEMLGDCISGTYTDCFVAPIAIEEDTDEDVLTILKNFKLVEDEL